MGKTGLGLPFVTIRLSMTPHSVTFYGSRGPGMTYWNELMCDTIHITMTVNGVDHNLDIYPDERLIDTLRWRLKLTGAKEGCGEGECGACTVLIGGLSVNACMVLTYQARDRSVETVEALAGNSRLDPLQKSFVDNGAIQCGYCTPGMVMSARGLLIVDGHPSEERIREAIAGNLCRCTGYVNIVKAIQSASEELSGEQDDA